ncbi:MAG: carboxylate--amine ligase [Elusimicrobia bacterium]|nr:carboxylate--amine ligase [Elusimicrobiota bacterium]
MNVLVLSPHFPPNFERFSIALRDAGAGVLAIGDAPYDSLSGELKGALWEYYYLDNMSDYESLYRAAAFLIHKHGRVDRIESHNEHWLGMEARLREDFNVFGQKSADLDFNRRKSGMKQVFRAAGVPVAPGEPVTSADQIRDFVRREGFPVVFKPDVGVGAQSIFRVNDEQRLAGVLAYPPKDYFIEKFVPGTVVSFDGLTDREGNIIFCASHRVNLGIMEIITEQKPIHYYYLRDIPPEIEELGRKAVRAFHIRERFFHTEFLVDGEGCVALEMNVRPPGGLSLDMMNWACDIDLYRLWARSVVCGESHFDYERPYNVAHVGRRNSIRYRRSHEDILRELSPVLVAHMQFPTLFRVAMGDYVYFLRHPELETLKSAIALVEEQA